MKPSGAHTHPDSSGTGSAVLVVLAVIVAAALARPVIAAVAELVRLVLIAGAVTLGLALTAGAALAAHRLRRRGPGAALVVHRVTPVTPRAAETLPAAPRPVIETPRPEIHLHLHGVSAADIAAVISQHQHVIEED
jgi:hypothetical protein